MPRYYDVIESRLNRARRIRNTDRWGAALAGGILFALRRGGGGQVMGHTLRGDGLASAALLGLPVMELLEARSLVNLAPAIIAALAAISLAWLLRCAFEAVRDAQARARGVTAE